MDPGAFVIVLSDRKTTSIISVTIYLPKITLNIKYQLIYCWETHCHQYQSKESKKTPITVAGVLRKYSKF